MSRPLPIPLITDNPIFVRELRRRMRGKAMIFSTNAYIIFMCLVAAAVLVFNLLLQEGFARDNKAGEKLFQAIAIVQAILVMLIAPSITSGMATAERERKTFDFLRVTTLSPFTFIVGGLLSTMLYASVVMVCALPILCISLLYGGVSPGQILLAFMILVGFALILSSAGLLVSSTREKTKNAQGITMVVVIIFGLLMIQFFRAANMAKIGQNLSGSIAFFGKFPIPTWLFAIGAVFALSYTFLRIAARKLYDHDARPLSFLQASAILCLGSLLFIGANWGIADETAVKQWAMVSVVFFFLMATTQCLHLMQIGDELWALKKRLPFLRGVEESVIFILLALTGWAGATWVWVELAQTQSPLQDKTVLFPGLLAFITMFVAIALSARYFAFREKKRSTAFRNLLIVWGTIGLAIPIVASVFSESAWFLPELNFLQFLFPYRHLEGPVRAANGFGEFSEGEMGNMLIVVSMLYGILATLFGVLAYLQYRRQRFPVEYGHAL